MRTELALVMLATTTAIAQPAEASCIPGFDYAAFGKDQVQWRGGGQTDSYDSSVGPYATSMMTTGGDLGTNGDGCGAVTLAGSPTTVNGNIEYGSAGSACSVAGSPPATINGTRSAQTTEPSLPSVTIPVVGTNQGNLSCSGACSPNPHPLAPNQTYGAVSVAAGKTLQLDAGTYVMSSLTVTGTAKLAIGSGPVLVYLSCQSPSTTTALQLAGNSVTNSTNVAGNLVFMVGPACSSVQISGGTASSYAVYAPDADVRITGGSHVYGAVVGKTVDNGGGSFVHYDRALATLETGGFTCAANEVSRATPIIAQVGGQDAIVQGTYELPGTRDSIATPADVSTFTFPYIEGHMRARTTASITTSGDSFSSGTVLFDAGAPGRIPPAAYGGCSSFDGTCRNVFTTTQLPDATGRAYRPPRVHFDDTTASTLGALMAPASAVPGITAAHWRTLVRKVISGKLGGVDRSTVAVIGPSNLAGTASRPTIVYFGATDGMLHAVCASVGGPCPRLGTELWAFMPRVQLPLVRENLTRIDGSPRVVDAFGDFDGTGQRSFRTILTFQTGYADASLGGAAVYALDVTDPEVPQVLWEHTGAAAAFDLGVGLALAAGPTLIDGAPVNLVVAQTNNGGTGGAGVVATALALETGVERWQFAYAYPSPPRGNSADLPLPSTGVPGGAVGVDLQRQGFTTDYVMGDLYGNLWRLDAATGRSRTGPGVPLFQFSTNKHPIGALPAIYSNGNSQFAAFGSGGYVDALRASWSAGTQSLIAIALTAPGPFPIDETSPQLALREDLGAGEKAFAQVLVVGGELFLATDSTDVNLAAYGTGGDTGRVLRYDLATSGATTIVVRGGAASLANAGAQLYGSSSDRQQQLAISAVATTGESVDGAVVSKLARRLWLRVE